MVVLLTKLIDFLKTRRPNDDIIKQHKQEVYVQRYIKFMDIYMVFRKNCVFHNSHWVVFFCTTNSRRVVTRERWQTFENS